MKVTEDQFRFEWFSGTGKGGQHRNKHQNCCRCIHEPTGIQANGTNSRSREDNKHAAYTTCRSRVEAHFHKDTERNQAGTERIRTYHEADNRVTDHASGLQATYTSVMDKGALDDMIEARAKILAGAEIHSGDGYQLSTHEKQAEFANKRNYSLK